MSDGDWRIQRPIAGRLTVNRRAKVTPYLECAPGSGQIPVEELTGDGRFSEADLGLPRSSYYDAPNVAVNEAELVTRIQAICEEFETYGYRRVGAALRQQGIVVNGKKVRRLMREHDLQPRRRRRFVATTDSAHHLPVFPSLARHVVPNGPNQLWIGDITYVAVTAGFVYVALILDAWSRRVVGYAISRSIDARLVVAALNAAIASRKPPRGCIATPTAALSTLRRATASCSPNTGSWVR